jgi:hypothetical protein
MRRRAEPIADAAFKVIFEHVESIRLSSLAELMSSSIVAIRPLFTTFPTHFLCNEPTNR